MLMITPKKTKLKESGQALVVVLVLLVIVSLLVTAVLGFASTGTKTGRTYDKKSAELYAADAGIQDATWQIRNQNLINTFPTYSRYNFGSPGWTYTIPPVNGETTDVTIQNMWMIPSNYVSIVPNQNQAQQIIIGVPPATYARLQVAGKTVMPVITLANGTQIYEYDVQITYYPNAGENLAISNIGLWLPPGYNYYTDSTHQCSLTGLSSPYNSSLTTVPWSGSNTTVWTFSGTATFSSFPGVTGSLASPPETLEVRTYFEPPQDQPSLEPDAVAWVKTSGSASLSYAWDASTTVIKTSAHAYTGVSTNPGTVIDSIMTHSEIPQLQTAQSGDYLAVGKTLMLGVDPRSNQRELLLNDSNSTLNSVPDNATVELAYLYWSGWLKQPLTGSDPSVGVFWDNGNDLHNWTAGNSWTSSGTSATDFNGQLVGHYSSGGEPAKYLTLTNSVDLTGVTSATIQWKQQVVSNPTPVAFRAAGSVQSGTTGAITPGLPAGLVNNDICVLVASTISGGSISITNNGSVGTWTALSGSPIDVANGEKLYVWWGRYSSGSTGPTLRPGSDHCIAGITAYYNVDTSTSPIDMSAVSTESISDNTFSFATGLTSNYNNEKVIVICTSGYDSNTVQFSGAFTNSKLTSITTRLNNETSNGGGGGFGLADGTLSTAGAVGTWSETLAQSTPKAYISFAFKPVISTVRLSISNDGGSSYTEVGNYPATGSFTYTLTSGYLQSGFKMRFYVDGFAGTGEYAYLDNIGIMVTSTSITAKPADTTVTFTINGGTPHVLTADATDPSQVQSQVKDPLLTPHDGYYYGCRVDVTQLVKNESNGANLTATPVVYGNGNGIYDMAGVYADSLKADGVTYGSASFAGWSLVIIYSSPDTLGHQLYLYDLKDAFQSVPASPANTVTKQITGFIVPKEIAGETDVAKLTCFVGEGDIQLTGDYVALVDQHDTTEHLLWDGVDLPSDGNTQASPRNVWNGRSTGSTASEAGIDLDTFHILWSDNQLQEGDTSANVDMYTNGDGYVTIYMILSFRSKITTGGAISYLIQN